MARPLQRVPCIDATDRSAGASPSTSGKGRGSSSHTARAAGGGPQEFTAVYFCRSDASVGNSGTPRNGPEHVRLATIVAPL